MESLETKTQLITLAQAAKRTGYTPEYLNSLSRQGILLAQKIGRNWFVDEKHLQSFETWIHSASYPKPGRKKNHTEAPIPMVTPIQVPAASVESIKTTSVLVQTFKPTEFKLPIFKERLFRFALIFIFFWSASVGLAYLLAHGQTKVATEKKYSPILSQEQIFNPQTFAENYQEKVGEVLTALNIPRNNLSLELSQKYFPDNSQTSELLSQNNPQQPEPKIAGAEKTATLQSKINIPPLSPDAWKYLFLVGISIAIAVLIFWFFYSIHRVFLQPVGMLGWIGLVIFSLASSLTLNQFIRRTVAPEINSNIQFNNPATAGKPSTAGKPNSKNGVQISGGKQTQEALVTASELDARLFDYVLKDSLKKNQTLAGDVYLNWNEKLKLARNTVKSREIVRHAIEAEDIDTGSITSRTIRNHTIQGEDINPNTDITLNALNVATFIDLGTNTIADGNFVGDWNFNGGDLTNIGTLAAGATTFSGNLDMQNNIIQNIGDAGTDFTATGGLNLAGDLDVNGLVNDIAGTLNLSGNALTASGLLTVTPALGLTVDTNGPLILNAAGQSVTLTGAATIFNTSTFYLNNTGAISIGTNGSQQNITFETQNFDVNSTGTVTIDGTNFTYTPTGTYTVAPGSTYTVDATGTVSIDSDATATLSGAGVNLTSDGANAITLTYAGAGGTFQLTDGTTRLEVADNGDMVLGDDGATTIIDGSSITLSGNTLITGTITETLTDNSADALDIQEGANNYININTTNNAEAMQFGNAVTNPSYSFLGTGLTTLNGGINVVGNGTIGTNSANTLAINSVIASDVIPAGNARDFGSNSNRWDFGYFDDIVANNITGVIVTGSTASNSWTINSDNVTNNAEIASLVFKTGDLAPINAVLQWNATNDPSKIVGFDNSNLFNFPIAIYSKVNGVNQTFTSGSLFKFSQPDSDKITQSGAFIGANIDFSTNIITVPDSASGNQTGFLATLKDGGAGATAIGFQTAGTLDYGLDLGGTIGTADIRLSNGETIDNLTNNQINLDLGTAGTLKLTDGSNIITDQTTFDLFNTTTTTLNMGGAATTLSMGAATGTASINNLTLSLPNATSFTATSAAGSLDSLSVGGGYGFTGVTISNAGAISADGLITGTGGLTLTGTANINATGTAATTLGNSTGALTIASGGTSSWTNTSGNLTIATAASGTLILDSVAAINIGNTNATSVSLSRAGMTTTVNGALTISQLLTGNLGATISGATINLNASSNFATNINTGTSTGAVAIGGNLNTVAIDSSDWNIDTTGVATNFDSYNGLIITADTGAITSGSWHGTVIDADHGGTGQTVYAVGDLLYASTTTALSKLADVAVGSVLISGGINTAPGWGTIGASGVTLNSLDFAQFQDTLDLDANLILNQTAYTWTQNFTGDATTGLTYNANSLTTGTAVSLVSTSTAGGASGSSYLLNLARSGANASASHSAYGIYSNVINTGATSTNIAGYFSASGATNNQSLYVNSAAAGANNYTIYAAGLAQNFFAGNIGIGLVAPGEKLSVNGNVMIGDATWAAGTTTGDLAIQGNVGIGTTGPIGKLNVQGDNSGFHSDNSAQFFITGGTDPNKRLALGFDTTNNYGAIQAAIKGTNVYPLALNPQGGNVGIGTTGPVNRLDVQGLSGGAVTDNAIRWSNPATAGALGYLGGDPTSYGSGALYLYRDGSEAVVPFPKTLISANGNSYLNGGNVGIGTTAPASPLHILKAKAGSGAESIRLLTLGLSGTAAIGDETYITFTPSGSSVETARISGITGPDNVLYGSLAFSTRNYNTDTLVEVMRMNNNGNVGIGTTNPTSLLDVTGSVKVGYAGAGAFPVPANALHVQYGAYGDTTDTAQINLVGGTGDNGNVVGFTLGSIKTNGVGSGAKFTLNELVWSGTAFTQGNTDLTVLSGGNVGIGTTGPTHLLELSASTDVNREGMLTILNAGATTAGRYTSIFMGQSLANGGAANIGYRSDTGTPDNAYIYFTRYGGAEQLVIKNDGNVGIGTTGPLGKLAVSNAGAEGLEIAPGYLSRKTLIQAYDRALAYPAYDQIDFAASAFSFLSEPNAVQGLYQNNLGNVGIGTTGPLNKLSVSGNLSIGNVAAGTSGTRVLVLENGTIPSTSPADSVQLYAEDVAASSELRVRDEAGNIGVLSPHNFSLIPDGPSESLAWSYYSQRGNQAINVDMARTVRLVEQLTGEKLIYLKNLKNGVYDESQPDLNFKGVQELSTNLSAVETDLSAVEVESNSFIASVTEQFGALGSSFYITDSAGNPVFSRSRDTGAPRNRDMTLTADSIILDGNVNITNGSLMVGGINLLEKTTENTQNIVGLTQNQNLIAEQLTGQLASSASELADQSLSLSEKLNIIGANLDNLNSEQYTKQIKKIKEQVDGNTGDISLLDARLTILETVLGIVDNNVNILGNLTVNDITASGQLEAGGIIAGAFTVKVAAGKPQTIGDAFICPVSLDENADGLDDRKDVNNNEAETFCYAALGHAGDLSSKVDTGVVKSNGETAHAITATAKIFINFENNPNAYSWTEKEVIKTVDQPDAYTGKFTIKLNQPVASPVKVNWWIVESQ